MKKSKAKFKSYEQNQGLLFPGYLDEFIPSNHLVRTVNKVINSLDLSDLINSYEGGGASSYDPKMMLKVMIYAYSQKIYSSRSIAKSLRENIFFMWLSGKNQPDFRTINLFRLKRLKGNLEKIFTEIVYMLLEGSYITLNDIFIDGTKLEADANKYSFVWKKSTDRYKNNLNDKVKELFKHIDELEKEEDKKYNNYDLPEMGENSEITSEDIEKTVERINKIIKSKKENKDKKEFVKIKKKLEDDALVRMKKYEEQLETFGNRNSYSKTDKDATFMRMKEDHMRNGQLKPGYNVQIATENQFVLNYEVYQKPGDTTLLIPFIEKFKNRFKKYPKNLIADSGYGSEENYNYIEKNEIENYVKFNYFHMEKKRKFKKNIYRIENLKYDTEKDIFICPQNRELHYLEDREYFTGNNYQTNRRVYQCEDCRNCDHRSECHKSKNNRKIQVSFKLNAFKDNARKNLNSEKGLEYRSRRCVDVEPVFAQIKHNRNYKRFLRRGLENVNDEWGLLTISHNLIRMNNLNLKN